MLLLLFYASLTSSALSFLLRAFASPWAASPCFARVLCVCVRLSRHSSCIWCLPRPCLVAYSLRSSSLLRLSYYRLLSLLFSFPPCSIYPLCFVWSALFLVLVLFSLVSHPFFFCFLCFSVFCFIFLLCSLLSCVLLAFLAFLCCRFRFVSLSLLCFSSSCLSSLPLSSLVCILCDLLLAVVFSLSSLRLFSLFGCFVLVLCFFVRFLLFFDTWFPVPTLLWPFSLVLLACSHCLFFFLIVVIFAFVLSFVTSVCLLFFSILASWPPYYLIVSRLRSHCLSVCAFSSFLSESVVLPRLYNAVLFLLSVLAFCSYQGGSPN